MSESSWLEYPSGNPVPREAEELALLFHLKTLEHVKAYEEVLPQNRARDLPFTIETGGYPRFVPPEAYAQVCDIFRQSLSSENKLAENEDLWVFPSKKVAEYCVEHVKRRAGAEKVVEYGEDAFRVERTDQGIALAIVPKQYSLEARNVWRHAGLIASFRLLSAVLTGRVASNDDPAAGAVFSELRERVADIQGARADDVFLHPTGMAAIHSLFQAVGENRGSRNVRLGWTYVDTGALLEKFGESRHDIRYDKPEDLDNLAQYLREQNAAGKPVSALFCEVPSNPLLRTIDLKKLRGILDDFVKETDTQAPPLIIDDTLGLGNIDVRRYADAIVTSLTKLFSGSLVMGGSVTLIPGSPHYGDLKTALGQQEKLLYVEDAQALLETSQDFEQRRESMNENAIKLAAYLRSRTDVIDKVYFSDDETSNQIHKDGVKGHGFMLSFTLRDPTLYGVLYDALDFAKGPSMGLEQTLVTPYPLLTHYHELDKIKNDGGIEGHLLRVSVGTEDFGSIKARFETALNLVATPPPDAPRVQFRSNGLEIIPPPS